MLMNNRGRRFLGRVSSLGGELSIGRRRRMTGAGHSRPCMAKPAGTRGHHERQPGDEAGGRSGQVG